ncbi:ParB/RepB/Spo0J family partition protein [Paracoccus jiaweipingae]|uniref:ParB/RepB/Spo0J family partition protein n=1 Tax=Paracoccus sp. p2-l61 TaxID=3366950 RepID=UPI0037B2AFB5
MSEPTLIQSETLLPVEQVELGARLRPVSAAGVAAIVASIREIGQMANPIVVRKQYGKGDSLRPTYTILDGAHRHAAALELGWTELPVRVFTCNDEQARLLEIDGNLAGAELNPLDTAVFLATRKAVYERLHPETKQGVAGAVARWSDATDTMSAAFVKATAEKFTLSERHIRRLVAAGSRLGPDEVARLRAAPKQVTLKDLQEIAKIGAAPERYGVVDMLAEGRAKSASDARKHWRAQQPDYDAPAPRDPAEVELQALLNAWSRARKTARRKFIEQAFEVVSEMVDAIHDDAARARDEASGAEGMGI